MASLGIKGYFSDWDGLRTLDNIIIPTHDLAAQIWGLVTFEFAKLGVDVGVTAAFTFMVPPYAISLTYTLSKMAMQINQGYRQLNVGKRFMTEWYYDKLLADEALVESKKLESKLSASGTS